MSVDTLDRVGKSLVREFTRAKRMEMEASQTLRELIKQDSQENDVEKAAQLYEAALEESRPAETRLVDWMRWRGLSCFQFRARLFVDASSDRGDSAHHPSDGIQHRVLILRLDRCLIEKTSPLFRALVATR